jgi:hypothetical protein
MRTNVLIPVLLAGTLVAGATPIAHSAAKAAPNRERSIIVTALDAEGAPVLDLEAGQLTIFEDGVAYPVTNIAPPTDPLAIVLLVDTSKPPQGMAPATTELRKALATFVNTIRACEPDAEIALEEFGGAAVMTSDFRKKPEDLGPGLCSGACRFSRATTPVPACAT